jgi:hypothetical protein
LYSRQNLSLPNEGFRAIVNLRDVGRPASRVLNVQANIIHYGYDLADYLGAEFGVPRPP